MSMLEEKSTGWWVSFISFLSFSVHVPRQMWATKPTPTPTQPALWGQGVSEFSGWWAPGRSVTILSLLIFKTTPWTWNSSQVTTVRKGEDGWGIYSAACQESWITIWCSFPFKSKQTLLSCTIKFHVEIKPLESNIRIMTLNPMIMATVMAQILVVNPSCSASLVPMGFSVPAQIIVAP